MTKIYIDLDDGENVINEIAWVDEYGGESVLKGYGEAETIMISSTVNNVTLYKSEIPYLEAAIKKARELGWF